MTPVAVITGAAAGIGAATWDAFAREGWDVVGLDRNAVDREGALRVDVSDVDAVMASLTTLPRINALVNNAAVQHFKPIEETTLAEWDQVQAVNLRGAFACLQASRDQLITAGGAVVNVVSVHARATSRSIAAYAASKGGLLAFTRAAALELAPHGVRVNAVVPGAVETAALNDGLGRSIDADAARASLVGRTPLRRIGRPDEVAQAILFLADPSRSGFITGADLVVDGGVLARLGSED